MKWLCFGVPVAALMVLAIQFEHDANLRCATRPSELAGQIEKCRQRGGVAITAPVIICGGAYLMLSECQLGPTR